MQSRIAEIRETDATVLAICADSIERNAEVVETLKLDFPILSDSDFVATKAFDLLHREGGFRADSPDIARPAVFILDQQGIVRWRHLTDNWRVRVRPETVLAQLSEIP